MMTIVMEKRLDLIEKLADLDDTLAELVLERESLEKITASELEEAIRRVTLEQVNLNNEFFFNFS